MHAMLRGSLATEGTCGHLPAARTAALLLRALLRSACKRMSVSKYGKWAEQAMADVDILQSSTQKVI